MAMPTKPKMSPSELLGDGLSREQLMRDLGIDEWTYESCVRDLFGFTPDPLIRRGPVGRVTQMGPGRRAKSRNKPNPKPEEK